MSTKGYTTAEPNDVRMLKNFPPADTPAGAMHMPYSSNQNIGDTNGADIQEMQQLHEAKWPQSARDEHKANGGFFAGPGTSFPLKDGTDVKHASGLYGHGDNPAQIKSKIISFAKSMGLTAYLPKEWTEDINDPDDDEDDDDGDDDQIQEGHGEIRQLCRIIEAQTLNADGHEVRVTILQGGKSANGYSYDNLSLQTVAQMVDGAQAYADHGPPDEMVRSVRDIVGFYHNTQYIPASGAQLGRVEADLHIMENASWLWDIIKESFAAGQPNLIGLSIDIFGQYQFNQGLGAKEVTRVVSLNSCDVVTRPSAGGSFQRILHHDQRKGDTRIMDPKEKDKTTATQDPPQLEQKTPAEQQTQQTPPATQQATPEQIQESISKSNEMLKRMQEMDARNAKMEELEKTMRTRESQLMLRECLTESILPKAAKEQIETKFKDRIFEAQELQNEMTSMLDMMAKLSKDGIVRGHGFDKEAITSGQITESEKVAAAFDQMFDLEIDPKFGNLPRLMGIREAYEVVTGGHNAFSGISGFAKYGNIRVSESAPIGWSEGQGRIQEADTTTASFAYLLGTSMNKRLLKDYQAWPAEWQKFTTIAPIRDYKQQTRVRFGHFGSLSIVPEDSAYSSLTLQDGAATYVPQKRGNLVVVSRETIINDDLQAVKQIPTKLAKAAAYTLAEFVYAFLITNPVIYDGIALFNASHGSNTASNTLSSAAMQTGVIAMRKQQDFAGKVIGLRPRFLVIPPDLEFVAMQICKSAGVPGTANNDINPMMGYTTPIVSPQLTSTTGWYMAADPREVDTVEIGFVGGQVNPALFVQDQPLFGLNFTQDVISYKIRHEYGAAVVDWRGLYRGNS
jgi:Mu-like prophage major head subunit gpT